MCLDRALLRTQLIHSLPVETSKRQNFGPYADPACKEGTYPALLGEPIRYNKNIAVREVRRRQNAHKAPTKRGRGIAMGTVELAVKASAQILMRENGDPLWSDLLSEMTTSDSDTGVFDHVQMYLHMKCVFKTQFSEFTISSRMATLLQKRLGRSEQSSYCLAHNLYPVQSRGNCDMEVERELVAVRVIFFCRIQFHSGEKAGEGICEDARFAYVQRLPVEHRSLHGHEVLQYEQDELVDDDISIQHIVPLWCISRPLIVDRSHSHVVTLIPFKGKGLVDAADDDDVMPDLDMLPGDYDVEDFFAM